MNSLQLPSPEAFNDEGIQYLGSAPALLSGGL